MTKIPKMLYLFCLLGLIFVDFTGAIAQPSNYKFYPKDYAKNPLEEGEEVENSDQTAPIRTRRPTRQPANRQSNEIVSSEPTGKKIESVSLVANGLDHAGLIKNYTTVLEILNKFNIRPSTIFLIGSSLEPFTPELNRLTQRISMLEVNTKVVKQAPNNWQIQTVPAWILTLTDGDVVLEGLDSPTKFINSKGEFIDQKDWDLD